MKIAPKPILTAALQTLSLACSHVRNHTISDPVSAKMINHLMDATHDIPNILHNWDETSLETMRIQLACFDSTTWPDAPNVSVLFEQLLVLHGGGDQLG